jgi:hypothetical protein
MKDREADELERFEKFMREQPQPERKPPPIPEADTSFKVRAGESDDAELARFEQFLRDRKAQSPTVSTDPAPVSTPDPKLVRKEEFKRLLEQVESTKPMAGMENDPDWEKFNKFIRKEANYSYAEGSGIAGSPLPQDLRGLNWGAFLMNVIWGAAMKVPGGTLFAWGLLTIIIPFFPFYLLFKGNELAWQNRKWASKEEFREAQSKWTLWGLGLLLLLVLACIGFYYWLRHLLGGIDPGASKFLMPSLL